jgi:hypothetical protein
MSTCIVPGFFFWKNIELHRINSVQNCVCCFFFPFANKFGEFVYPGGEWRAGPRDPGPAAGEDVRALHQVLPGLLHRQQGGLGHQRGGGGGRGRGGGGRQVPTKQWSGSAGSVTYSLRLPDPDLLLFLPVFRIHDILVRFRIRGFMPLTNGSGTGFGSPYFCH